MSGSALNAQAMLKKQAFYGRLARLFRQGRVKNQGREPSYAATKLSGQASSAPSLVNLPVLGQNACFFAVQHCVCPHANRSRIPP
jgi:hypothetical protein